LYTEVDVFIAAVTQYLNKGTSTKGLLKTAEMHIDICSVANLALTYFSRSITASWCSHLNIQLLTLVLNSKLISGIVLESW